MLRLISSEIVVFLWYFFSAVANDVFTPQDKCQDSTITYNVTLRGGIDAGKY